MSTYIKKNYIFRFAKTIYNLKSREHQAVGMVFSCHIHNYWPIALVGIYKNHSQGED